MRTTQPVEPSNEEKLRCHFVRWLPRIQRTLNLIAARKRLNRQDADEYAAFVYYKFVERDYAAIRQFRGQSRLESYLFRVLERLFVDFRRAQWGKWRPSAAAQRLGRTAVQLEQLLYRDGHPLQEAVGILRHQDSQQHSSALQSLAAKLPNRPHRRFDSDSALKCRHVDSPDPADSLDQERRTRLRHRLGTVLAAALRELPPKDRRLIVLYFLQRLSMREIALKLGCEAKPLFRRRDRILKELRLKLQSAALNWSQVKELLGRASSDFSNSSGRLPFSISSAKSSAG